MPEELTINCSKDAPIPKCLLKGHCWKDVKLYNIIEL